MQFLTELNKAAHKVDLTRAIVVPHIAYYIMVAAQFQYRVAAGVVAIILVAEVIYGHHGAHHHAHHKATGGPHSGH